jgi:hypothetical protein
MLFWDVPDLDIVPGMGTSLAEFANAPALHSGSLGRNPSDGKGYSSHVSCDE